MNIIPYDNWRVLQAALSRDTQPGARFLLQHLKEVQELIESDPTGKLVPVTCQRQVVALAGITSACSVVHVHFVYIVPQKRYTNVLAQLLEKITQIGLSNHYGYVALKCPQIAGLEYMHNAFLQLAVNKAHESMSTGTDMVTYIVPRAQWETMLC